MEMPQDKNSPATGQKAAHAGSENIPLSERDQPQRHFDGTPLEEAIALGRVDVTNFPDSPDGLLNSPLGNRTGEEEKIDDPDAFTPRFNQTETKPTQEAETPKKSWRNRILASVAGLVLVAGGSAVAYNAIQPKQEPVAEAPADPNPESPEGDAPVSPEVVPSIDVTQIPEDVVEYNLFETLTEDQQAEILAMKNESVEEFRQRPFEEQLKFSYYIYENNLDVLKYRLDETGQSYIYEKANFETAEGMKYSEDLKRGLLASLITMTPEDGIAFDMNTALKASSYLYSDEERVNARQNIDGEISSYNLNTPLEFSEVTFVDSAVQENGDIILNAVNQSTQTAFQTTYGVIEVETIQGDLVERSVSKFSVTENDPRYIEDIHQ
jgi:hypothetical protein